MSETQCKNMSDELHPMLKQAHLKMLKEGDKFPDDMLKVEGYDFNRGIDYTEIFKSIERTGFQATHVGRAIRAINAMIDSKFKPVPEATPTSAHVEFTAEGRRTTNCTIMLGYTSNMVSSANRDIIRYLVQHNMVDCLVTTAGGVEEDIMKCLHPFYIGDFTLKGAELYEKSHNRTGNLIVSNTAYKLLHEWLNPILDDMMEEQKKGTIWTPSTLIHRMGKEINNPSSIYYWAYQNNIPVLSPAITDGAIGDILYFHRHKNPQDYVRLDVVDDVRKINDVAILSAHTGIILLGAGLIKHHILNANCGRGGSDFTVYINTAAEFDGSDAGASPDEAVSWGKVNSECKPVKVFADATLLLPILVAETFAKREHQFEEFYLKETRQNGCIL